MVACDFQHVDAAMHLHPATFDVAVLRGDACSFNLLGLTLQSFMVMFAHAYFLLVFAGASNDVRPLKTSAWGGGGGKPISYHVISYHTMLCHVVSCQIMTNYNNTCHIMS